MIFLLLDSKREWTKCGPSDGNEHLSQADHYLLPWDENILGQYDYNYGNFQLE